jgi:hypothetical protein
MHFQKRGSLSAILSAFVGSPVQAAGTSSRAGALGASPLRRHIDRSLGWHPNLRSQKLADRRSDVDDKELPASLRSNNGLFKNSPEPGDLAADIDAKVGRKASQEFAMDLDRVVDPHARRRT